MHPTRILTLTILAVCCASPAAAGTCVSCSGPAATYDCSVKKAEKIESFGGAKAIQKICTKVLKRSGQHNRCETIDTTNCTGTPTTIGWKEVKEALASPDEPETAPTKSATDKRPATKDKASPPGAATTVSKGVASPEPKSASPGVTARPAPPIPPAAAAGPPPPPPASAEPVEADTTVAGNIKGAAEKTWNCLASLFGKC